MSWENRAGTIDGAEPLYRETLDLRSQVLGTKHRDTLTSMNNLAFVLDKLRRYGEAEPLYRETLDVRREVLGTKNPDTLTSTNNLAFVLDEQGRYGEAEPLYREALDLRREVLGPKNPDTLTSMNNLASMLQRQGRYGEAEPLYRESLDLRRQVLGLNHRDTIGSVNNLATVLVRLGRYGEAEPMFREALDLNRQVLGPKHPNTLVSISNLGGVLLSQERYSDAERLYREALDLYRELLGSKGHSTLICMNGLAFALVREGRYRDAEPLLREALESSRQVLGPHHPDTLATMNNLASMLASQGRYGEAEPLYRDALDLNRQAIGQKHPDTLVSMNNLAFALDSQGRYGDAEPLYREALDLSREVLGANHPNTLVTQLNLTVDLAAQDRVADAVALHRQMEPWILDRLGVELYTTESASVRRQMVASQSNYQDVALTLAQLPGAGAAGSEMAASALLRFKGLAVEEDAYLARLAQRGEDEHIRAVAGELQGLHAQMARLVQGKASAQGFNNLDPKEIVNLTARVDAKQLELGRLSRSYGTSLQVRNASLKDLRDHLAERSALLDMRLYHRIDFKTATPVPARLVGVLITPTGDIAVRDLGPADEIDAKVNILLSGSPEAAEGAATALYQQLRAAVRARSSPWPEASLCRPRRSAESGVVWPVARPGRTADDGSPGFAAGADRPRSIAAGCGQARQGSGRDRRH